MWDGEGDDQIDKDRKIIISYLFLHRPPKNNKNIIFFFSILKDYTFARNGKNVYG